MRELVSFRISIASRGVRRSVIGLVVEKTNNKPREDYSNFSNLRNIYKKERGVSLPETHWHDLPLLQHHAHLRVDTSTVPSIGAVNRLGNAFIRLRLYFGS